jgi:hypothetical protein
MYFQKNVAKIALEQMDSRILLSNTEPSYANLNGEELTQANL